MSRKKIEKTIRRCFKNLKSTEKNIASAVDAVSMLREVRETSLEIFQSLLSLVSQTKARSSSHGWSVVSKLFQSKRVSCEAEASELEKIDAELLVLKSSKDINPVQVHNVLKGLVALESDIQEAEEELEASYRKLLKTRVTILNILSHYIVSCEEDGQDPCEVVRSPVWGYFDCAEYLGVNQKGPGWWSAFALKPTWLLKSFNQRTSKKCRTNMAACHVRSISLPSRSHPLNASVEDQLDRLRSSLTTSTSAYHKLTGLKDLYECVEDFLQLPSTQQTLSNEQQKERGEEVLNGSLLLLDMCSTTRDVFSSMKECLQELESSLRRRKGGESGFSSEVESYMMSRKKIEKTIRRCFKNLKSTEKNIASAVDAVSMLREVRETSLEIFQSLLSFVSQAKARSSSHGWSVVSKLFQSKRVSCEAEASELEKIDAELLVLKSSKDINPVQVQNVLKGLVALESDIQEAEEELEASYRKLLKTRDKMAACHVRSISLPSRSHPLNASVEDQLDRLRSSLTTSTSAYHKLSGLKALYECVEDFLQLPSTQQTLSSEQQKERGEEVLNSAC
uniref:Uncharacterized protein n=1 Tax=Salix viminalis TaxID=40686 RepID=A0A6N2LD60_SALVM